MPCIDDLKEFIEDLDGFGIILTDSELLLERLTELADDTGVIGI